MHGIIANPTSGFETNPDGQQSLILNGLTDAFRKNFNGIGRQAKMAFARSRIHPQSFSQNSFGGALPGEPLALLRPVSAADVYKFDLPAVFLKVLKSPARFYE